MGNFLAAERACAILEAKAKSTFSQAFRGILCNWLVCLAVYFPYFSENNLADFW